MKDIVASFCSRLHSDLNFRTIVILKRLDLVGLVDSYAHKIKTTRKLLHNYTTGSMEYVANLWPFAINIKSV